MNSVVIYHNPKCSKSRESLEILNTANVDLQIIKYLDEPLDYKTIKNIIKLLDINPIELIRKNEKIWKEQFKNLNLSHDEVIKLMITHPKLMERPIIINGDQAVIGRPPQKILDIL